MSFRSIASVVSVILVSMFLTACGATIQVVPTTSNNSTHYTFSDSPYQRYVWGNQKRCRMVDADKRTRTVKGVKITDTKVAEECRWYNEFGMQCTSKRKITVYDVNGPKPEKVEEFDQDCRPPRRR